MSVLYTGPVPLEEFRAHFGPLVHATLARQLELVGVVELREAMRHLTGRGKLLRPLLALATYRALTNEDPTPWVACSTCLELVHVFSLIHDDLPALDDAELRRGRPAVHVQYGEALAVLAGDGLLALALDRPLNERAPLEAGQRLTWLAVISGAIHEMIEGEILDLLAENRELQTADLQRIHELKSGALLGACCQSAAVWAGAAEQIGQRLKQVGIALGLAFQIGDDLLSVSAGEAEAGKTLSSDQAHAKATYPRLLGVDGARSALDLARRRALDSIDALELKDPQIMQDVAEWIFSAAG